MALWRTRSCLAEPNEPEQLYQDLRPLDLRFVDRDQPMR